MTSQLVDFTAVEVKMAISGKFELYHSIVRYGYYLPKYKSNIINEAYLTSVLNGAVYCPKYADIKLAPCPFPPDKETLVKHTRKIKVPGNKPLGLDDPDHLPDKGWLLALLSTHRPDLNIFAKSYVPPPRVPKVEERATIKLPSDFLTGLPASRKKTKAKRLTMISKGKAEAKLERAKFLAKKYGDDEVRLDNEIKRLKKKSKLTTSDPAASSNANPTASMGQAAALFNRMQMSQSSVVDSQAQYQQQQQQQLTQLFTNVPVQVQEDPLQTPRGEEDVNMNMSGASKRTNNPQSKSPNEGRGNQSKQQNAAGGGKFTGVNLNAHK